MTLSHIVLAWLWILYCLLHSILASRTVKKKLEKSWGGSYRYYRLWYTLFSLVFLVALIYYQSRIPALVLFRSTGWIRIAGWFLGLSGGGLMLVCIKKYFIGLSGLLSLVKEETHPVLLITGIHRYVRHPLYLGTFAFIYGLFLLLPHLSLLISDIIITVYTCIGINLEEQKLILEFGERYKNYQKKVPKLIPFRLFQQDPAL